MAFYICGFPGDGNVVENFLPRYRRTDRLKDYVQIERGRIPGFNWEYAVKCCKLWYINLVTVDSEINNMKFVQCLKTVMTKVEMREILARQ